MAVGKRARGRNLGGPELPLQVPTRPLTAEEEDQLLRVARSARVRVPRVLGILLSLGAVLLAVTWFLGFPYDPDTFLFEAPIVGLIGLGLASAAAGTVRGPRSALRRNEVLDLTGVAQPFPGGFRGIAAVTMGPVGIAFPTSAATRLTAGLRHRVVLALETRKFVLPDLGPSSVALILALDDERLAAPMRAYVAPVAGGYQSPPVAVPTYLAPTGPTPPAPPAGAASVFCPKCGYENSADARFCPRCGSSVPVIAPRRATPG